MALLIKNGHLVDPGAERDGIYHILVGDNGRVSHIFEGDMPDMQGVRVVDADGFYVFPGFTDLHVHFREPGFTKKETIRTGAMAAAHGGFTTVCAMPNTKPVIDSAEHLQEELDIIKRDAIVNVLPIGSMTVNQDGMELSDLEGLKKAGAVAISEDGKSVMDSAILYEGLKRCKELDLPFFDHCEDKSLVRGGVINAGKKAEVLGLPGITNSVEDSITARDIIFAKEIGTKIHICHVSTKGAAYFVYVGQAFGADVTAEVCPHHFMLCDDDIPWDDANYKMNPPLRSREDMEYVRSKLADGTIGMISTDHAPHTATEKKGGFMDSPFGIVGLETAFPLAITGLLGTMTLPDIITRMSLNPAKRIGTGKGTLKEGSVADFVIADLNSEYVIDTEKFLSMGKNTPFSGMKVKGKIIATYVAGRRVYG
ncbi:MAG: dihydroorotase [Catonella sp.]|nr:dihydroorotase [Catonella sp.]MDY6356911.1 dihydroorotase [Catonella sp.]